VGVQRLYWSKNFVKGVPFSNGTHYQNPVVDKLLEDAAVENDATRRLMKLFKDFQDTVARDVPDLNLYQPVFITIANQRVHDHSLTADGVDGCPESPQQQGFEDPGLRSLAHLGPSNRRSAPRAGRAVDARKAMQPRKRPARGGPRGAVAWAQAATGSGLPTNDVAGMPSVRRRRIMCMVNGRLPLSTS
jgi:hypothetical protein